MSNKKCVWALLSVCGSLLAASWPAAAQPAEPAAQHASAADTRVVCHRVTGSRASKKQCATREEWRAREVVCLWGTRAGAETKEKVCNTVAQWRALGIEAVARRSRTCSVCGPGSAFYKGDNPTVPGGVTTVASPSSFQR